MPLGSMFSSTQESFDTPSFVPVITSVPAPIPVKLQPQQPQPPQPQSQPQLQSPQPQPQAQLQPQVAHSHQQHQTRQSHQPQRLEDEEVSQPPSLTQIRPTPKLDSQTEDDEMDNSDTEYTEESVADGTPSKSVKVAEGEEFFKLGTSKSPVIEAFIYCALKGWGVELKKCTRNEVEFTVTDFDRYYSSSNRICSKHRPTEDISARIKGLKRWFPDFPARKSQISDSFTVSVGKDKNKLAKIRQILQKNREVAGICKLRRSR
eukprot:TRINITY_DN595_c1_g1_i1.p1 TRINITY_DN595_c1_g1~~TRINITY_DN595_c1_g1_i1.p1  ORF type:complete len:262 (-),score=51.37 TRINITY_DN595_c1_g1_i1:203-988(-)